MIKSKLQKLSLVAALAVSTSAFGADTIKEAISNGKASGAVTLYSISNDNKGGTADSGFSAGTLSLAYETDTIAGFSAKVGFIAGHDFEEFEPGDASSFANDALMTEAYIKYANDSFFVVAGRQAIDLEWLGDYNEAVVAGVTAIPDTTIVAGYTERQVAADEDEIGNFDEITEDGAYVLDIKYSGVAGLELNPYFYSAPDVADFYGLKASYSTDMFSVTAQYAQSDEETQADGSIGGLELGATVAGVSLTAGYAKAEDGVGAASITAYGDNMNPFDNGANFYGDDAQTFYGSVGYEIAGIGLGALYGETEFAANSKEQELNLTADYSITEELSVGVLYVDYDLEGSAASDYKSISATVTYSF